MGKKNKLFGRDLSHLHRDIDSSSYETTPQGYGTLADQIREKILGETVENLSKPPEYAVDIISKAFENKRIRLKQITVPGYTAANIRGFFSALDYVDTVYVRVDDIPLPYVSNDSLFFVKLGNVVHKLPVSIFWMCLPQSIKDTFKNKPGSFFKKYHIMFSAYGRKLVPTTSL